MAFIDVNLSMKLATGLSEQWKLITMISFLLLLIVLFTDINDLSE